MKMIKDKRELKQVFAKWACGFLLGSVLATQALAAQSSSTSMSVRIGTYQGKVSALNLANESKLVNLYTDDGGNLSAIFKFPAAGLGSSIGLSGLLRQHNSADIFTFQVLNTLGNYINVGSTTGGTGFKVFSKALPENVIVNGAISIRLLSSAGADDIDLDQLILLDQSLSPIPTPPPPVQLSPPVISSFTASSATIPLGQNSTLSWSVANSTNLVLNPGNINVSGLNSLVVTPSTNTAYTLMASNISGSSVKSLNIAVTQVTPPPPPVESILAAGTKGYLQLQGTVKMNVAAKVYDIDLYDNSATTFASLKQSGHIVICYFSAGTYENWRSDANQFPAAALGNALAGWPGEKWLDVRNPKVREIVSLRMDLAKSKGCDGVDPDNVDGYSNSSGFPLTKQDQINFNIFLADQAHSRGLIVGLKNSTDLVSALVSKYDFAVVEECFKYNECSSYSPFVSQNKAVFNAEYSSYSSSICSQAASLNFSTVFYNLNLDGSIYNPCP